MEDLPSRTETLAPWITGLALACPVLVAFYPPMSDLPYQEAAVGLLRWFHDATRVPPGLYVLNLGEPNQLFHMVAWALAYVVSTRWAVKLTVAATVAAIPVCAARLARHAGGNGPVAALLVAPVALGWLFTYGLITNLIGLAALLALLPALDRLGSDPTPKRVVVAFGATVILYFAHLAMMLVYSGAALGLTVLHPWSWRKSAWRTSPLLAGLAITLAQTQWQKRYMTSVVTAFPLVWESLSRKLLLVPSILLPSADPVVQAAVAALWAFAVGAFLLLRARENRSAGTSPQDPRAWALRHRWTLFAAAGLAAYVAFPLSLNGATLVYQRWLPPAFAVLAACSAPRDLGSRAARMPLLVAFTVPVATLLVSLPGFADSDRQFRFLERLLPEVAPGSAVAQLAIGPNDPSRTYSLGAGGGRVLATRGGRLSYSFADSSISPVFIPRAYQWEGALLRASFGKLRPDHDLRMFRYVLALAEDVNAGNLAALALADDARLVDVSGPWMLFESRLPVIPPRSPPPRMEDPPPETLTERAARIVAGLRKAQPDVRTPRQATP